MRGIIPLLVLMAVGVLGFGNQATAFAEQPFADARMVIRGPLADSEIVITTTPRVAGAVHSLTWRGREFIDSFDHGRQLQSASNLDLQTPFTPETFNPTEAGSLNDGHGPSSTSQLLHALAQKNSLQTTTRMAFWLAPGQQSGGQPAKNFGIVSDHLLTKRVTIGYKHLPQVIQYNVTFSLPVTERHNLAQFEAVTGYMPAEFQRFLKFNSATGELQDLTDGPGEQSWPVVLATKTGSHAMGVYSPDQPSPGFAEAGYGRFRFPAARVTKWNCVFRIKSGPDGVAPGDYSFRMFVLVGDLNLVTAALRDLHREFAAKTVNDGKGQ